jgi:hypothetical protein
MLLPMLLYSLHTQIRLLTQLIQIVALETVKLLPGVARSDYRMQAPQLLLPQCC